MLSNINNLGLLVLLSFLTGCSSCEDRGQITVVEGRVTDVATGNPAVGASVVLWHGFTEDFGFGDGIDGRAFSAEKITDSTGFYSITFFNSTSEFYRIQVTPTADFDCSEMQEVEIGERNELDFTVLPQDTLLELQFTQIDFENNPDSVAVSIHFETACVISTFELNNYVLSTNLGIDNTLQVFTQSGVQVRLDFQYFEENILVKNEALIVSVGTALEVLEVEY